MTHLKLISIIAAPLVEWLRNQNYPLPQPPIRFYPDGSLWTDDPTVLQWRDDTVIAGRRFDDLQSVCQLIGSRCPGAYSGCSFRPLAPFAGRGAVFSLIYPGSCTWMGERESAVLMYPGGMTPVTSGESNLGHLQVLVRLRRNIAPEVAAELADSVRQWFMSVGSSGVFGESGIASISATLRYDDRKAGFEIDARGSGQETLNSLYLAILNWGMARRRPLCMIWLGPPDETVFDSETSVPLA